MQPPDRDTSASPPISSPPFENAPPPELNSTQPPPIPPVVPVAPPPAPLFSRIPRWRWAMSLLLVGFYPLFVSLLGRLRSERAESAGPALPDSVAGLLRFSLLELAVFAAFWSLGWAFSRASKDELLLRWRGGVLKPIWQGFGYALALRIGLVVLIAAVAMLVLTATGTDPKQLEQFLKQNQPKTDSLFPKGALSNPLYLFLTTTLISFVVAGLREELWRVACLAALRHLLPSGLSENARWISAIALSSVVFGLGHIYQGGLGVVLTGTLGAGLAWVTWRHRSIWPAVFAHGFIDATSFLAAAAMAGRKIPLPSLF